MYLKRLELRGFKTFATFTDLRFDEGITAIVGPNGSGKSNIADAVRWVLGEQSYTNLRGKRTEDMIFAGTRRRAQMGMAEAIMTFDNESKWLPIDFGEVTVGRRAYRSGENRYLLNGSRVRLRDVEDLLGRAGLGRRGLVTIGQGVADAALSLRPEERRVLFEEAAGIRIYQDKRTESLNRLAETEQNVVRLHDILSEITPRLRDLERQAHKAEEHRLLSSDLEELLRLWYGHRWQRLQAAVLQAEASLQRRSAEVEMGRGKSHEIEALLADTHLLQSELRRQLSVWHERSSALHSQAEQVGRELAVRKERCALVTQRKEELAAELETLETRRGTVQEALGTCLNDAEHIRGHVQDSAVGQQLAHERWSSAGEALASAEQVVEDRREAAFQASASVANDRNRLAQLTERLKTLNLERTRAEEELLESQDRTPTLQEELRKLEAGAERMAAEAEASTGKKVDLQDQLAATERALEERRSDHLAAVRAARRTQDRLDVLQGARQSLTAYTGGAKAILAARSHLPGIVGAVAELLQVPKQFDAAIEAALGPYSQAIVVNDWEAVKSAISFLRRESAGWATFLPLDSLSAPTALPAPAGAGVVGVALELVTFDDPNREMVRLLLGSVVVIDELDAAQLLRDKLRPPQRLVTLKGEVVRQSGMVSGGSDRQGLGILAQEREWRQLPARLDEARTAEERARGLLEGAVLARDSCRRELEATIARADQVTRDLALLERQSAELSAQLQRAQQEAKWRQALADRHRVECKDVEGSLEDVKRSLKDRVAQETARKAELDAALRKLDEAKAEAQAAQQRLAEAETELALAERQLRAQEQMLSSQQSSLTRLEEEYAAKRDRVLAVSDEAQATEKAIAELRQRADALSTELAELAAQITPGEVKLQDLERQAEHLEKETQQARRRLTDLEALHSQQLLDRERRNDELQALERQIDDELGEMEYPSERARQLRLGFFSRERAILTPPDALPENIAGDIKELKSRLRRLGSINPSAPQEYEQVRQRHGFLSAQIQDLERSAASLQEVIRELDEIMQTEFLAVFRTAAVEFTKYFEVLFGGGQAKLVLTDPDQPSTTGVDIIARPPGKRLQSLALLSGGERALTATSLLFAILKARPLPFCLLDEVDAMLDEANVGRFRALLEGFAKQTQFIVITHNRQTIEAASTIYGISMGDDGASQVLSLRLDGEDVDRGVRRRAVAAS